MALTSARVKEMARVLGADLCGIAPIDRFVHAPAGAHPRDALPSCRSVIVVAKRFLHATLQSKSSIPYTIVRNLLSSLMDDLTLRLSYELEKEGTVGVPTGAIGPTNANQTTGRSQGLISLKHAAELAGLGRIGKNSLLVNDEFGNMIWLGAVITDAQLEPDPLASYETCPSDCEVCIQACPVEALDGPMVNQRACWNFAFGSEDGGEWRIKCHRCRTECPSCRGI